MPALADKDSAMAKQDRNKSDKDDEGEVVGREVGG